VGSGADLWRRPNHGAYLPGHICPGPPAPHGRRCLAFACQDSLLGDVPLYPRGGRKYETHTLPPIEVSWGTHSGPKFVSCPWDNHQFLGLQPGRDCWGTTSLTRKGIREYQRLFKQRWASCWAARHRELPYRGTVVPGRMPSRGPDMPVDMRLEAALVIQRTRRYPSLRLRAWAAHLTGAGLRTQQLPLRKLARLCREVAWRKQPPPYKCRVRAARQGGWSLDVYLQAPMCRLSLKALRPSYSPRDPAASCRTVEQ
jgi:hypothetical protein